MREAFYRVLIVAAMITIVAAVGFAAGGAEPGPGSVVVYSAGPGGLAENIAQGFEAETGIRVEMYQATTGAVLGRLEAEADNPHADVVVLASWPAAFSLLENGWLEQYRPANAELLHDGWNHDDYFFGYSASALGVTYNTDRITDPGSDWTDYADPRFRGIVAMPDPSASGSALDFLAGYVLNYGDDAWSLFQQMRENELELAGANRPALDSVITASNYIVLAGVDYMAYGVMAQGNPIDIYYPRSGTVVNPRPAMMTNFGRNRENARKFMDYLLSEDAQRMVADVYIIPGRRDIPVHPDRVGMDQIPLLDIDWGWMAENQSDINDRFQQIFR